MESIRPLPESVRSSVRSGFIISDMIRVVEELVYNSLDAGSTKVLVSVGVGTGYVKVEDNGCGITRDGLALLGERYATSKYHTLSEPTSGLRCFGYRGEVLCSIADVSLVEIITKAKGRPNGYRKLMKGSKCLYLGIDNDRWDAGTTVTVSDMFYNQPVRRTHMQTSPKKLLHSVKKCVLQIALVRPQVSFSIVDIESEGELLRTHASSSPMAILISHFGIKVTLLHELSLSEGPFELAGYISSSPEAFAMKGIQHIYVNSRFIDKSPIHKLLNGLASSFWEQLNNQGGKRSRPQAISTYCLNLTCPQSLYDINIEQSKTSVEFKDWLPLLSFIEKSVISLWSNRASNGKLFSPTADTTSKHHTRKEVDIISSTRIDPDFFDTYEIPKKKCRFQNNHSSQPALSSSLFPTELGTREISQSSYYQGSDGVMGPSIKDDSYWMCPSKPYNHSDPGCSSPIMGCTNYPWDTNDKLTTISEDRNLSSIGRDGSSVHGCFSSEEMGESPVRRMANYKRNYVGRSPEILPFQFEDDEKPYGQKCSSSETASGAYFKSRSPLENLHDVPLNSEEWFQFHSYYPETKGEFIDPCCNKLADIDSELIPSQEDFVEDLFSSRKYNCFVEDHISSQEMDECPRMASPSSRNNVPDPSLTHFLPSRFQDVNGLFLRNCSSLKNTNEFIGETWSEFRSDDRFQRADSVEIHGVNENLDEFQRRIWQDDVSRPFPFIESKAERARSRVSFSFDQDYAAAGDDKCDSMQEFGGVDASFDSSDIECEDMISDSIFGVNSWEHQSLQEQRGKAGSSNHPNFKYFKHEKDFGSCDFDEEFTYEGYLSKGCSNSHLTNGCKRDNRDVDDSYIFGQCSSRKPSASKSYIVHRETDPRCPQTNKGFRVSSSQHENPSAHVERIPNIHKPRNYIKHRDVYKATRKRSHSAPPHYQGKRKFLHMNAGVKSADTNPGTKNPTDSCGIIKGKITQHSSSQGDWFPETNPVEGCPSYHGQKVKEAVNMPDVPKTQNRKKLDSPLHTYDKTDLGVKWRNGCPEAQSDYPHNSPMRKKFMNCGDKCTILNVSSGILHLASDTIVPKSINRNCLEASRVLMQIDKKFIPVVAGKILAVIDQHAADERIRLEDLRNKVLSGKMKTVAYLEEEKEMMLPESLHQLLHYYANQIKHWGWICNIFQDSQSFSKNLDALNKQPDTIRLLAVPCILGVNLSDSDLLEFVKQLADTDGSSTVPPSVLRILNYKSCRGAIMFGDTLLPSECALIVDELKRTSLCFQCAHGRPTMAPLVNLEALHKQIQKLGLFNNKDSGTAWHGLERQPISLERAKQRLGRPL